MKHPIIPALLLAGVTAFTFALPRTVHAAHYRLFVLTGQSNSLGVTNGGEPDPTSGTDPADAGVLFAWHNRVDAGRSLGHSGLTLGTPTTTAATSRSTLPTPTHGTRAHTSGSAPSS